MALYRLRDQTGPGLLNLEDEEGKPERLVRLDPKLTYNTDDPVDAEILAKRPGLFREVVTEAPKRGRKKADEE